MPKIIATIGQSKIKLVSVTISHQNVLDGGSCTFVGLQEHDVVLWKADVKSCWKERDRGVDEEP